MGTQNQIFSRANFVLSTLLYLCLGTNHNSFGQTNDSLPKSLKIEIDSAEVVKTEKVLYLRKKNATGRPKVLSENTKIFVKLKSGSMINGTFIILDSTTLQIENQSIDLNELIQLKAPKKYLRKIGGPIAYAATAISILAFGTMGPGALINTIPFIGGTYLIVSAKRNYNLETKYTIKVLEGTPTYDTTVKTRKNKL